MAQSNASEDVHVLHIAARRGIVLLVSSKTQPAQLLITMLPGTQPAFTPRNATICPELTDSRPGVKTSNNTQKTRPTGPARYKILDLHHTALTTISGLIYAFSVCVWWGCWGGGGGWKGSVIQQWQTMFLCSHPSYLVSNKGAWYTHTHTHSHTQRHPRTHMYCRYINPLTDCQHYRWPGDCFASCSHAQVTKTYWTRMINLKLPVINVCVHLVLPTSHYGSVIFNLADPYRFPFPKLHLCLYSVKLPWRSLTAHDAFERCIQDVTLIW